jgi:hypothetical protein
MSAVQLLPTAPNSFEVEEIYSLSPANLNTSDEKFGRTNCPSSFSKPGEINFC